MASQLSFREGLFQSDVNPNNKKSRTLPLLNLKDKYGRAFHLSWIGFFVAFLSWFAFPPLIHGVIQEDLQLSHAQIANSNIVGLLATFFVRLVVGPLCDRYGPRHVMIGCLLLGAFATALTPLVQNATHLIIVRFFVGILGGTFVPCQVWTNQFFDTNIIGFTNALAAGWGNAGGGLTFFVMPSLVNFLINRCGISQYWAWRLAFPLCPSVIIVLVAIAAIVFGDDTPSGPWKNRNISSKNLDPSIINNLPLPDEETVFSLSLEQDHSHIDHDQEFPKAKNEDFGKTQEKSNTKSRIAMIDILKTSISLQTLLVSLPYLCSFGSEIAVEGVISDFYVQTALEINNQHWSAQKAGNWAAIFGLLNVFTRPLGGYLADRLYLSRGVNAKKWWMIFLQLMQGVCFVCIGLLQVDIYSLLILMTDLALFMEAANGAVFSLVPHVNEDFTGVVSGVAGGFGNIGGVFFGLLFRLNGKNYRKTFFATGIVCIVLNLFVSLIPLKFKKTVRQT